jgi:hypothetical protein
MIILAAAIIIILVSLYFFIYGGFIDDGVDDVVDEGFASGSGSSMSEKHTDIAKKCQTYSTCSTCLKDTDCGWAADYAGPVSGMPNVKDGTILACIPQQGGSAFITGALSDWISMSKGAKNMTNFITSLSKCTDVTCSANTTCDKCAFYQKCTWQQTTTNGVVKQMCVETSKTGSGSGSGASATVNNITTVSMCPPPQCSDLTDCVECANMSGCAFCSTSGKCLKTSEFGAGANQCAISGKIDVPSMCPCSGITDCKKCAARAGCGYCKDKKTCLNLDMTGMVSKDLCKPENVISGEAECNPPASGSVSGSASGSGSGSKPVKAPTAAEIDAAANSGNLFGNVVRPEGEYNTTKGKMFKMITAPGVARNIDDSNIPFTVRETSEEAQLNSYLKEMVNSQLAAQGVPTNEPFVGHSSVAAEPFVGHSSVAAEPFISYEPFVSESDAIPNASEYMKKVFRGVLS